MILCTNTSVLCVPYTYTCMDEMCKCTFDSDGMYIKADCRNSLLDTLNDELFDGEELHRLTVIDIDGTPLCLKRPDTRFHHITIICHSLPPATPNITSNSLSVTSQSLSEVLSVASTGLAGVVLMLFTGVIYIIKVCLVN